MRLIIIHKALIKATKCSYSSFSLCHENAIFGCLASFLLLFSPLRSKNKKVQLLDSSGK